MSFVENLTNQLKRDEGVRLKPYYDTVGKLTIGVGRNLSDKGITEAECDFLLQGDVQEAVESVERALPWSGGLVDSRRAVLVNMAFNMGIGGLLTFTNMLGYLRNGLYDKAAEHLLRSAYASQVGARAVRLAEQLRTGVWQ